MTRTPPTTFAMQTIMGFELSGLSPADLRRVVANTRAINHRMADALRHEIAMLGIHVDPRLLTSDEVMGAVPRSMTAEEGIKELGAFKEPAAKKPTMEPGLPLRQFVRGFLRDHLGMSKIVAHTLADLFMVRWMGKDKDGTADRYANRMDDDHTLKATADRKAGGPEHRSKYAIVHSTLAKLIDETSKANVFDLLARFGNGAKNMGELDVKYLDIVLDEARRQLAELEQGAGEVKLYAGATDFLFPNHAGGFDTKSRLFSAGR